MKAKTIPSLRQTCLESLDRYAIYSFDLFDTILSRRIEPPELVHRILAEKVARHLEHRVSAEYVLQLRAEVEQELRQGAHAAGCDFECRYGDLAIGLAYRLTGAKDTGLERWIQELELRLEDACLVVKPGMKELLQELHSCQKTVIVASDMYLCLEHIQGLLQRKAIASYIDRVFVSSEGLRCKYSGKLFADILSSLGIEPQEMLHCGDNKISDYRVPRSFGIDAVYLREKKDWKRRQVLKKYHFLSHDSDFWKGRYLLQVIGSGSEKGQKEEQGFFYRYGYEVLGPIYCSYLQGLVEDIQQSDVKKLYFLARDGFLLQKLFQKFAAASNGSLQDIGCQYVFLSRQSTAPASLAKGLDHFHALLPLYNPKQQGIHSILRAYSLPAEEFVEAAARHGFSELEEPIFDWHDPRLQAFLQDEGVQARIRTMAREHKDLLQKYLEEIGFFQESRVGLVDIGWNATIQYFLGQVFGDEPSYPEVHGLYFGFCQGIPYQFTAKDRICGIFYDERREVENERVVMSFEELFEESCRAMHATTVGYRRQGRRVRPKLKDSWKNDRMAEKENNGIVRQMQKGVLDFADEFIRAIFITGFGFSETKPFAAALAERAVAYPRKEEVARLQELVHTEDWGYDNILAFETKKISRLLQWKRLFLQSNWKYGVAANTLGRLSLPVLRYLRIMNMARL